MAFLGFFLAAPELISNTYSNIYLVHFVSIDSETTGKVTKSKLKHGSKGGWRATIEYAYWVGDFQFRNDLIVLSRDDPHDYVSRYPVAMTAPVFYASKNPNFSYLEPVEIGGFEVFQVLSCIGFGVLTFFLWRDS